LVIIIKAESTIEPSQAPAQLPSVKMTANVLPTPSLASSRVLFSDPNSYAGCSFILLVGPPKSDRLKDRRQTK